MAVSYDVNYDDERFTQVESDKSEALTELEQTYGGMIGNADKYYQDQIEASKQWADKQSQLQQEQTDFAIEQIEQQKGQAHKDYLKEQSGAYVDWQKQSNRYGTEAERLASAGMTNTGFGESSQVGMYNSYQNRVASARESYNQAVLNYNNAIKDARLQNNSVLAEIAYQAQQQQLELSLQGFQYKNQLILEQANKKVELDNMYYNRYMDVLNQINQENAMAEDIRQFEENKKLQIQQLELQTKELDESIRQFEKSYELKIKEFDEGIRQFNAEMERLKKKDAQEYELEIKRLGQQAAQLAEQKRQFNIEAQIKREQLAEEKRQFNAQLAQARTIKSGSGGSGAGDKNLKDGGSYTGISGGHAVSTPYYQGSRNPDAKKYGTFSNGYQPKGISGHGKLTKSGKTIEVSTQIVYGSNKGQKQNLVQTVWKAEDGTLWYWEGRQNKYLRVSVHGGGGGKF